MPETAKNTGSFHVPLLFYGFISTADLLEFLLGLLPDLLSQVGYLVGVVFQGMFFTEITSEALSPRSPPI